MKTFAYKIIEFNEQIHFNGTLPKGIQIMNPFKENPFAFETASFFYKKYYNDNNRRRIILGINPGRFGAGVTGVPFTDTKRLSSECGIDFPGKPTHEPSATFIYEMIRTYGGPKKFYGKFYIHSICPLGFTIANSKGKQVNYNYYDSRHLEEAVSGFIVENLKKQIAFGVDTDICYCFGTGKNEKYLNVLNAKYHFFKKIVALEHPRFIMQYKAKTRDQYIDKYLAAFAEAN